MITSTRLHQKGSQDEIEAIELLVKILLNKTNAENTTEYGTNLYTSRNTDAYQTVIGNPSRRELDILVEHRRNIDQVFFPSVEKLIIFLYGVLITWGFLSNCLVCYVVSRQCKKRTMSHTGPSPRNLYIVNLAVADLLLCLLCMPISVLSILRKQWIWGAIVCKIFPLLQNTIITVSAATIAAIAFDRYFTIVRSPKRSVWRFGIAGTLTLIWSFSLCVALPLTLYQRFELITIVEKGEPFYQICVERWPSPIWSAIYTSVLLSVQFFAPVVTLIVIHLKISLYLNLHMSSLPKNDGHHYVKCDRINREWIRNRRTMCILTCVAAVFAFSWLPLTIFSFIIEFYSEIFDYVPEIVIYYAFFICHLIAMSSAGTNPLLYGYLNTNFRRDLTNLLITKFGDVDSSENPKLKQSKNRKRGTTIAIKLDDRSINSTNAEPVSVVVRSSRDRRFSSSFGTTLSSIIFRTRSSSAVSSQNKVEAI